MAAKLQLESQDGTSVISLIDTAGFDLIVGSNDFSLDLNDPLTTRSFTFLVHGTSKADVRAKIEVFYRKLRKAKEWKDDIFRRESIWLREVPDGASAAGRETRQLIENWTVSVNGNQFYDPLQLSEKGQVIKWTVTTYSELEDPSSQTPVTTAGSFTNLVGQDWTLSPVATYQNDNGTAPGRIGGLELPGQTDIDKLWIGIRDMRYGATGWNPLMKWSDGWVHPYAVYDTDFVTGIADSFSTSVARVRFSSVANGVDTLTMRVHIGTTNGFNAIGYAEKTIGSYMAILRYKSMGTSGKTFTGRLATSYYSMLVADGWSYNGFQYFIDDGEWHMLNMGLVKLPPRGYRDGIAGITQPMTTVELGLELASLDAGQGLYLDTLTMVPYDHYIALEDCNLASITYDRLAVVTHEDGLVEAVQRGVANAINRYPKITGQNNWRFPIDGGTYRMIICGERATKSVKADYILGPTVNFYRRWDSYRS